MLHALVRGAVLAQADAVVREDVDHAQPHQRGHAHRVAAVVAEGEEGAAVGDEAAVQRHAVERCRHAEFAHAPGQVVARTVAPGHGAALEVGEVGAREVGRAAEQLGQQRRQRIQRVLARLAGGDGVGPGGDGLEQRREPACKVCRQIALHAALERRRGFGEGGAIRLEALAPGVLGSTAALARIPGLRDLGRQLERCVRPAQRVARGLHFVGTQGGAVHVVRAGLARRSLADHGLAADQRGLAVGPRGLRARGAQGGVDGGGVVPVHLGDHVPAIGFKALRRVVGEPALDVAVDADAVVVVQRDQLGQAQRAGQRAGLVADAFHQAAVAHEDVGVVVDHGVAVTVELGRQQLLGQRHAHRVGQALAERASGGLHAGRDADLGVARRLAVQLAEALQLVHGQVVAGQVQQRVQQHRAVAVGEHEAVAVGPSRVGGVVLQVPVPQYLGDLGHAHGRARVAALGLFDRVDGQHANRVGHLTGEFGFWNAHVRSGMVERVQEQPDAEDAEITQRTQKEKPKVSSSGSRRARGKTSLAVSFASSANFLRPLRSVF